MPDSTFCALGPLLRRAGAALLFFGAAAALAAPNHLTCAAALAEQSGSLSLQVPYLVYKGAGVTASLRYSPSSDGLIWFKLASAGPVTDGKDYSECQPSTLSADLILNLPLLTWSGQFYSTALQLVSGGPVGGTDLYFKVVDFKAITAVNADQTFASGLNIAADRKLVVWNLSNTAATTLTVQGDFTCLGDLDVLDAPTSVRINVSGNVTLGCNIRFAKDNSQNKLTIVAGGALRVQDKFNPPTAGHLILTDDAGLIATPETYATDATTDDGVTPVIMPSSDSGTAAALGERSAVTRVAAPRADCPAGNHVLGGLLTPPIGQGTLPQGSAGPVVLAAWFRCDVELNAVRAQPPVWDAPEAVGDASKTAKNGSKGLTLNLKSQGKIKFTGDSVFTLMDGGDGQSKSVTGNPAVAIGGNGGASGDLKIAAAGGIDLSAGTLTIVPGRGGHGGNATANGTAGADGCPGKDGASASATGGNGADSKKVLRARGFDPTGKVFVRDVMGGHGGNAQADGGNGGHGTPGRCNGGAGGAATAQSGKGGDASFRYVGTGAVAVSATLGGNGGNSVSTSGAGGNGGNQAKRCDVGGNGGVGGTSTAKGGLAGTGSIKGTDGAASASVGRGTGGSCGDFNSSNGNGGRWSEFVAGVQTGAGDFAAAGKNCTCAIAQTPKISISPGEFVFAHVYNVSPCPTFVGTMNIQNSGDGNFNWQMSALPAWLSASKTSGKAGDSVQLNFTCEGWSADMSTTLTISGTDSATGQALGSSVAVPVSGTVRGN